MSYFAEGLMKQSMSPQEYKENVEGPAPQETPVATPASEPARTPEPETPTPGQPLTPEGAANIEKERQRYIAAGYDDATASRLLGGPRSKLGA